MDEMGTERGEKKEIFYCCNLKEEMEVERMQIKRRDFLKASVAACAAIALTGTSLNAFAQVPKPIAGEKVSGSTDAGKWIPSTCQGCTQWCPVEFFVRSYFMG